MSTVAMIDIGKKPVTERTARARCRIEVAPETVNRISMDAVPKGDVLGVAKVAAIMAAKRTDDFIPLCHSLSLSSVSVNFRFGNNFIDIETEVKCSGKTGVEMEALTSVSVCALTVYDMCKSIDKSMVITDLRLVEKTGGRSGVYLRDGENGWSGESLRLTPADSKVRENEISKWVN